MWSHNIRVVVLPIILAFSFLGPSNSSTVSIHHLMASRSYLGSKYHLAKPCEFNKFTDSLAPVQCRCIYVYEKYKFKNLKAFQGQDFKFSGDASTLGSSTVDQTSSTIFIYYPTLAWHYFVQLVKLAILVTNPIGTSFSLVSTQVDA